MPAGASAQQFLSIEAVREDTVILKDGGLRVVLMCSSLNFALKSADEQDAIIYQFQNFLNSLDFSLQFVIHSRKLNVAPYLDSLKSRQKEEDNELLQIHIQEYTEFIRTFVDMTNIMSKTFFVVVPFTAPILEQGGGPLKSIFSAFGLASEKKRMAGEAPGDSFAEYKNQLWQRADTAIDGFARFGIRSAPLNTEELIELFYGLYNPTEFEKALGPTSA